MADEALKSVPGVSGIGPRGGNTERVHTPEARRAPFRPVETADEDVLGLHRFRDTAVAGKQNEQAWHRMAAYMILAGRTNAEIARAADRTIATVSQLRAQRWFQELLATLANERGQDVLGLLQSEAVASVLKIVDLRDTAESEKVQLAAATTLLNHANGMPVQKVLSANVTPRLSPKEELSTIKSELAALRKRHEKNITPADGRADEPPQ